MGVDKYELAAIIALAGLDAFEGKMSAAQQRTVFGANLFGKKSITIHNEGQGAVDVRYSAAFGTDEVWTRISFEDIANAVVNKRKMSF